MKIVKSKHDYLAQPLTRQEIEALKRQQQKWQDSEKRFSMMFMVLAIVPVLIAISVLSSWAVLGMAMAGSVAVYIWFKMWLPSYLDKEYECSVIIDDKEVVTSCCNGLAYSVIDTRGRDVSAFEERLKAMERVPVLFERKLFEHES